MNSLLQPWQLLLIVLAGWLNRQQQAVVEYLRAENQVLKDLQGRKRLLLNDEQRRRLAVKGKLLGRQSLKQVATIVTPDTIMRWHRQLVAAKRDSSSRRKSPGRPPVSDEITQLVLRIAKENPAWGYDRIQGAAANLGHAISDASVANILKRHGIEPAPQRKRQTTWTTFVKAHWDVLAAIDFTTVEVWTKNGLGTFYLLFAIELASRRVHFAGCTTNPDDLWMKQIARNLTASDDGFLSHTRYLQTDRDGKFTAAFIETLRQEHIHCLRLPPRSPNLNAHVERFMRSIKSECLSRMIFFGERSLRNAVREFIAHYHQERNHQGLDNKLIEPGPEVAQEGGGGIQCRERLGGMLRYYYRDAA